MGEILLIVAGAWVVSKIFKNRKEVYNDFIDETIDDETEIVDDEPLLPSLPPRIANYYSNNYSTDFESIICRVKKKV